MNMITRKRYIFTGILALLALATGAVYFFMVNADQIDEIIPDIELKTRVQVNTDNQDINGLVQNFTTSNNDRYEIAAPPADVEISDLPISDTVLFSEPLYLVVNHRVALGNITTDEVNNALDGLTINDYSLHKIYIHQNDLEQQTLVSPVHESVLVKDSYIEIINALSGDQEAMALIPLSQLDISVKPLDLDGFSWENQANYPVRKNIYIDGHINAVNQITNYIKEYYTSPEISTLLSVGDIMMGRYVGVKINRSGDPTHSFQYVSDIIAAPDLTFAQLETPIAPTEYTSEGMILVAQPDTITGLTKSGIDIVSISGNHFGDAYHIGMEDTFRILDENDIKYIGAGTNLEDAWLPEFINLGKTKIGFISFVSIMPASYGAGEDYPGSAWIDLDSDEDFNRVITALQEIDNQCDILIAGFHWGTEYTPNPIPNQIKFAHAAVDAGADLIVGTHPHVVQADEIYHDTYITYSLGNFIMDQMWSEETREGVLMYSYIYDDKIISIDLIPTQIMDYSQVRVMDLEEGRYIIDRINQANSVL